MTDALALSDRFLRGGASDQLLRLLIECEENRRNSGVLQHLGNRMLSNSWQYCLRLKDKQLAAQLALRYVLLDTSYCAYLCVWKRAKQNYILDIFCL